MFLFVFSVSTFIWNDLNSNIAAADARNDLEFGVFSASEFLVRTSGNPAGWNASNASALKSIGLANLRDGFPDGSVLNATKAVYLAQLLESNYSEAKRILGLGSVEFGFSITNKSRQLVNLSCAPSCWCGAQCWAQLNYSTLDEESAFDVAALQRAAVLEFFDASGNARRQIVNLNVFAWVNSS